MTFNTLEEQLSLPLIFPQTFDEMIKAENAGELSVQYSTRLKRSWHLKINRRTGARLLTVPRYLQSAPQSIKSALIEWACLPVYKRGKNSATLEKKRNLEQLIQSHICSLDPSLYSSRLDISKLENKTRGHRYDLREIFDTINNTYFDNSVKASVRWGSYSSLTSYQTCRLEKNGTKVNLITIAGVYNHPEVPLYALQAVMYHEMLHIVVPPYKKNGRNVIHSPEFKKIERQFAYYNQWHEWERHYLRNLAKSMKRKRVK